LQGDRASRPALGPNNEQLKRPHGEEGLLSKGLEKTVRAMRLAMARARDLVATTRARRLARTRASKGAFSGLASRPTRGMFTFQKDGRGLARARPRGLHKRPRKGPCKDPYEEPGKRLASGLPAKEAVQGAVRGTVQRPVRGAVQRPVQGPCKELGLIKELCEGLCARGVSQLPPLGPSLLETPLRAPGSTKTEYFQKRSLARTRA
jgi:hypothetical protein